MQETRRAILDAVADGPASGPDLADRLDCSRNAVWKHVEALRAAGFDIESTDAGYRLRGLPEFGAAAVEYGLDAPFEVEYHDAIGSTNARARELAREGRRDVVVLADEQTGGRGRLDRSWASPSGGVWLSVVLGSDRPPADAPVYTLAAAVALVRAVAPLGVDATIKWPNDVLVGGGKLAGVLTEMAGEHDRIEYVVLGMGLNANVDPSTLPACATSLRALAGDVDRRALTQRVLEAVEELRTAPETVLAAWRDHTSTLGSEVRVETPRETITGEAVDVEFPGTLVVETATGRRRVTAGDCEHLRPAE
jgi:BirA family biotin operon repressor/biotin-[acetyl-CoA-carboxylase] ligase